MNPPAPNRPLSQPVRWSLAALAVGLTLMLAVARRLDPDPRGFGTHEQLGLTPCPFLATTGRACPACGATTAVAEVVRGRWSRAWRANPAGMLLGILAGPTAAWLLATTWMRRPLGFRSPRTPLAGLLVLLVAVSSAFWLMRFLDGATPAPGPNRLAPEPRKEGAKDDPPYDDEDATSRRPGPGRRPAPDHDRVRPPHDLLLPPAE